MTATPPTTPPTIGPILLEDFEEEEGVGEGVLDEVEPPGDVELEELLLGGGVNARR